MGMPAEVSVMANETKKTSETGLRIKQFRDARGLSQEALARAAGNVTKDQVSSYERGEYGPSTDRAKTLAKALGVTVDVLLGTADPETIGSDPALEEFLRLPEAGNLRPEMITRLRAIRFSSGPPSVAMWRVIANQYVVEDVAGAPVPVKVRPGRTMLDEGRGKKK